MFCSETEVASLSMASSSWAASERLPAVECKETSRSDRSMRRNGPTRKTSVHSNNFIFRTCSGLLIYRSLAISGALRSPWYLRRLSLNLHQSLKNREHLQFQVPTSCTDEGVSPVWPDCNRPHMMRSTAAFVCAATATLQPLRGPSLFRSRSNRWIAATSNIDFPVPKGPWMMHRGLQACIGRYGLSNSQALNLSLSSKAPQ